LQDGPSAALRRGRVLAGDQIAVDDHMWLPVGRFRIDAAVLFKHIFHEERHDVGQSDGRLLRIGETGHRPVFDQRGTTGMALFTLRAAEEVRAAQFGIAEGELDAEMVAIAKAIIAQRDGKFRSDDVSRSLPGGLARTNRSQDEGAHR
jgi:hypothetical protein